MKILNISLDASILEEGSRARKRHIDYGRLFDEFHILILYPGRDQNVGNNIWIYSVSGNKIIRFLTAYKKAKRIIKNRRIDLISSQDPFFAGLLGWLLKVRFGLRLQIQIHTDFLSPYFRKESIINKIRVKVARFLIWQADKIRVVSKRIESSLEEAGIPKEKIIVIPIYSKISETKRKIRAKNKQDKFIFLTIGRLSKEKNIQMQIKAMAELSKKYFDAELWIIGDGPQKEELKEMARKLGIEQQVKFFGWQKDLEKFYEPADIFLLTSDYEGWGMVVVEAASFGLPIIMTNVGLAGEFIKNNENGIIIPVADASKLEESMIRLINNEGLRQKLCEKSRQSIRQLPSKEKSIQLYKESFGLQ